MKREKRELRIFVLRGLTDIQKRFRQLMLAELNLRLNKYRQP